MRYPRVSVYSGGAKTKPKPTPINLVDESQYLTALQTSKNLVRKIDNDKIDQIQLDIKTLFSSKKKKKSPARVIKVKIRNASHGKNIKFHISQYSGDNIIKSETKKAITVETSNDDLVDALTNKNTLDLLFYQNLDRYKKLINSDIFNKFISWHRTQSDNLKDNLYVYSGFISLLLGIRDTSDVDCYIHDKEELKNTTFPEYIDTYDITLVFKAFYLNPKVDIKNPNAYISFLGVKLIPLKNHLYRRYIRQRPKAIAELMLINKYTDLKAKIPDIPEYKRVIKHDKGTSYIVDNEMVMAKIIHGKDIDKYEGYILWEKEKQPVDKERYKKIIANYVAKIENVF